MFEEWKRVNKKKSYSFSVFHTALRMCSFAMKLDTSVSVLDTFLKLLLNYKLKITLLCTFSPKNLKNVILKTIILNYSYVHRTKHTYQAYEP